MSEFTPLRQAVDNLADRTPSPDFDELQRRATSRGRRRVAAIVGSAAAALIAGSAFALTGLDDERRAAPAEQPKVEQPEPTLPPISPERFEAEVRRTLAEASAWVVLDRDPWLLGASNSCQGDWSDSALGGSGGDFNVRSSGESASVWADKRGFPTSREAAAAVASLVDNFASCAVTWQTEPIAQTGAVLAYSGDGVVWIQQQGTTVATLQAPTADGPPPANVQTEIADLLTAYIRYE